VKPVSAFEPPSDGAAVSGNRAGRRRKSILIATIVAAGLVVTGRPAAENDATTIAMRLPIRGIVRAVNQAAISTDLAAPVTKVAFKEGEAFRKGDILIAFDCRHQRAELAAAEAQRREMTVAYESAVFLEQRKASSRLDVETAHARADKAAADVEGMKARIDHCTILAPYDGRVNEVGIREYEMPGGGKPLLSIIAEGDREIELIVPSVWLSWLKAGAEFDIVIDETRKSYAGVLTRIGAAVDSVSQTIKVSGRFKEVPSDVLPGMSGTASFPGNAGRSPARTPPEPNVPPAKAGVR
jgi:membrane fusion protein (multidrug efflux system)